MKYFKCEKCGLNYVPFEGGICGLCANGRGRISVYEEEEESGDICPFCDKRELAYGEEMCRHCREKRAKFADDEYDA
jgi:hypothetical protein